MFQELVTDAEIQEEKDVLGGGGILDSGIYDMAIGMAYADKSAGGALSLNLTFKGANGETLSKAIYVTSGKAKGCLNYYIDKNTGDKRYLPGFNQANALCLLTVGKELSNVPTETKTINIYDYELKKDVPKQREVLVELLGKHITLGVIKQVVDKNVKDSSGQYVPSGETREENELDKVFRAEDGMTVAEIKAEAAESEFKERWATKNTGVTRNKAKGATANTGVPGATTGTTASPAKNLFV